MPTLTLFTLAYFASLLCFHNQAELPRLWSLTSVPGGSSVVALFVWVPTLAWLARQGSVCRTLPSVVMCICMGLSAAQISAGTQAAEHRAEQVPLRCNKAIVRGEFKLLEKAFRDNGAQTWLIAYTGTNAHESTGCLQQGARLQLFVDNASRHEHLQPGDLFRVSLRLKPARAPLQLQGFDIHRHWFANRIAGTATQKGDLAPMPTPHHLNPLVWIERLRFQVAQGIVDKLHSHPEKALVLAMVVGDQGLISAEDRDLFNNTGIAHLVAISGLHITLFAMLAGKGMGLLWRRSQRLCLAAPAPLAGSAFGLLFAVFYSLIAGWGVPAQRTVFMLLALFVSQLRGGSQSSWDTFFMALFLTLAFDNWAVLDAGFQLSFGAVAVLVFVTQGHHDYIKPRLEALTGAIKAQYAVTVGLVLPCAMLFNQQSLISPASNALSIPWMSFVSTPLALAGGLLQNHAALHWAAESLRFQRMWLNAQANTDWAVIPLPNQPGWVYAITGIGTLFLLLPRGLLNRWLGLAMLGFLAWPAPRPDKNDFWITFMDVGQGTAIAVQTQRHLLVYDAGPAFNTKADSSRRIVLPWMSAQGYGMPDMFMLSHDDADHAGGAPFLIARSTPAVFATSTAPEHPLNMAVSKQGGRVMPCHHLQPWTWDGVRFHPLPVHTNKHSSTAALKKNNQSCVLKISNATHSVLLTGDIEAISEMQLLASHGAAALRARVLVVPHHGSKTSSTVPFLQAVQPEHGVVQSGWENQFGHPHRAVVQRYQSMNIGLHNTAQNGAMLWQFQHNQPQPRWQAASTSRQRYWHMHESGAQSD